MSLHLVKTSYGGSSQGLYLIQAHPLQVAQDRDRTWFIDEYVAKQRARISPRHTSPPATLHQVWEWLDKTGLRDDTAIRMGETPQWLYPTRGQALDALAMALQNIPPPWSAP